MATTYDPRWVGGLITAAWDDARRVAVADAWTRVRTLGPEHRRALEEYLKHRAVHVPGLRWAPQLGLFAGASHAVWIDDAVFPVSARSILVAQRGGDPRWIALTDSGLVCVAKPFEPTPHVVEDGPATPDEEAVEDLRLQLEPLSRLADNRLAPWLTRAQVTAVHADRLKVIARLDAGAMLVLRPPGVVMVLDRDGNLTEPTHVRLADPGFELPLEGPARAHHDVAATADDDEHLCPGKEPM